jgi:acyl carrier protein
MRGDNLSLEQIQERIKERVAARLGIKPSDVKLDSQFIDDLGTDSLDVVELVMALEEEFRVNMRN